MKKRILRIFSIIAVALLLSGCVKYNINVKINNNKKMTMELIIATSKSMQGTGETSESSEDDEDSLKKLKDAGWTVEEYEDDTYKGSKLKKTFDNIDEITTDSQEEYDLNALMQEGKESKYMFYKEKGTNVYKAKFKASANTGTSESEKKPEEMTPEEKEQYEQSQQLAKQMMSTMDLKMNVEVPKLVGSNATTVDGNKLTWDLTKMKEKEDIEFSFELVANSGSSDGEKSENSFPIVPVAIGGGVALVVILVIVVLATKKKKPVEAAPAAVEAPIETLDTTTPVAPVETPVEAPVVPETPVEVTPVVPETKVEAPVVETPVVPEVTPVEPVVETPVVEPTVEQPAEPVNTENNNM